MNPTSEDIATMLNAESSLGLTLATDLFFAQIPPKPADCVAVFDSPGAPPQLTYKKATSDYYYSGVTVQVRNTSYGGAYDLAFQIMEFLHGESNITIGSTLYTLIKAVNDPQLLHYDEGDRPIMFINFDVQRRAV